MLAVLLLLVKKESQEGERIPEEHAGFKLLIQCHLVIEREPMPFDLVVTRRCLFDDLIVKLVLAFRSPADMLQTEGVWSVRHLNDVLESAQR